MERGITKRECMWNSATNNNNEMEQSLELDFQLKLYKGDQNPSDLGEIC